MSAPDAVADAPAAEPPAPADAPPGGAPAEGTPPADAKPGDAQPADAKPGDAKPEAARASDQPAGGAQPEVNAAITTTASFTRKLIDKAGTLFASDAQVSGDVVSGDKIVIGALGSRPARAHPLPENDLEEIRRAFGEPEGYAGLLETVRPRPIVILRGPAGAGKQAAATRLLLTLEYQSIHRLNPDDDLSRLAEELRPATAYLLCDPTSPEALRRHVMQGLEAGFQRTGGRLIVTMSSTFHLADEELSGYVVEADLVPDASRMLRGHLEYRLGPLADTVLADPERERALVEVLGDDVRAARVRDLAVAIWQETDDDGAVDVEAVRRRFARRADENLDIWFRSLPDTDTRCFAIALAALNGLPTEYVAEAAVALRDRLEPEPATTVRLGEQSAQLRPRDRFAISRSVRLRRPWARITSTRYESADYGSVPADVAEYVDPAYPKQVILRAWRDYDIQRELLDWLAELVATHPAEPVRVYAAAAVGYLATHGFEQVLQRVLNRWKNSDNPAERQGVAHALAGPANDPRLRPVILKLTRTWQRDPSPANAATQATAARVWGCALGERDPALALENLDRLAMMRHDLRIQVSVGWALADLLTHDPALTAPILARLLRWLRDRERQSTGELAFLVLANGVLMAPDPNSSRKRLLAWPALLSLADEQPELRGALATLWRLVLGGAQHSTAAEWVLERWARRLEPDERGCVVLAQLVRAASEQHDRTRRAFLRQAAEWTSTENLDPSPRAAAAVRRALDGRKEAQ
jgi:hypothetical protein